MKEGLLEADPFFYFTMQYAMVLSPLNVRRAVLFFNSLTKSPILNYCNTDNIFLCCVKKKLPLSLSEYS